MTDDKDFSVTDAYDAAGVPYPGSDEAIRQGCLCPVIDNHFGRGFPHKGQTSFWITESCPLHGVKEPQT